MKQIIKNPKLLKRNIKKRAEKQKNERDIFEEELTIHLLRAEDDIENGRTRPAEEVFKKWDEKYGI